jgi:D-ribose pyranase
MKKNGLLNYPLSSVIASLGHTDTIVIADAGLPIPVTAERIDLAVKEGLPLFLEVLKATLDEMQVESAIIASEMAQVSPELHKALADMLGDIPVTQVAHAAFKAQTAFAKAVVRTGEFTPYANVILVAGVIF